MNAEEKLYLIRTIDNCADEFYRFPEPNMTRKRFKEASLERWAFDEVMKVVVESENPLKDLGLLSLRTSKWMMSENMDICQTFSILNEAVEFAMDLINGMKGEE